MDRKEVALLLRKIDIYYEGRIKAHDPKERFEHYAAELKDIEFEKANETLLEYIKDNHFPPSLVDFIKGPKRISRSVPGLDDTRKLIDRLDNAPAADEEVAANALAEMRRILGINQNGGEQ